MSFQAFFCKSINKSQSVLVKERCWSMHVVDEKFLFLFSKLFEEKRERKKTI